MIGCSNKISFAEMLEYFNHDYDYLNFNNQNIMSGLGTTDLVYQGTLPFKKFVDISFKHCNNDLLVSGETAKYAFLNFGINYNLSVKERSCQIKYIIDYLKNKNINLINAHTVFAEKSFISLTLISDNIGSKKKLEEGNLFLTKPLGGRYNYENNKSSIDLLEKDNSFILNIFNNILFATDISGYGLYNELFLFNKIYKFNINIFLNQIPSVFENVDHLDCSAKRNMFHEFEKDFTNIESQKIFGSEFNGPILFLSPLNEIDNCFKIGFCKKCDQGGKIELF
ncbi:MAG: hypothetical protein ACK4IX_09205 [Candidatus Sericytochromatia bacterium]|uniref:hypothetical protein n=1 Tax=Acinetobacter TaxID=469 RepID=UPI000DCD5083|nr:MULTISPECIES: hypothetical protein [Acinetobacter]MCU4322580.1 hypothetical protein [Acinetobacter schindleri]RAZ04818.1 hypothetical protein C8322_06920 [Acinetobacter sp. SM1B]